MTQPGTIKADYVLFDLTFADGATVSDMIDLQGLTPLGIFLPDNFSPSGISPRAYKDGTPGSVSDPVPLYDLDSTIVAFSGLVASSYRAFDPTVMAGVRWLHMVSDEAQTCVCQVVARAL